MVTVRYNVKAGETLERAATAVLRLIAGANEENPGAPVRLEVTVRGHRNHQGAYDKDMLAFQNQFLVEWLLGNGYVTALRTPLTYPAVAVKDPQRPQLDVPKGARIVRSKDGLHVGLVVPAPK